MPTIERIDRIKDTSADGLILHNLIDECKKQQESQYLERFFELSVDMICIAGTDGYYKKLSRSFETVLGFTREELMSKPYAAFLIEEDVNITCMAFKRLKEGEREFLFETRFRCKNGNIKWLSWKSVISPLENLVYAVARDITEQKQSDQKLLEYNLRLQKYKEENLQSLRYAGSLQRALMPEKKELRNFFPDSFIFYAPKHIVSGDFYWFESLNEKVFVVAADCTGHGVPGALLSVMGINILHNALIVEKLTAPSLLLRKLDCAIHKMFSRKKEEQMLNDGMDLSVCVIDKKSMTLEFSAINNPIYLIRNQELIVVKSEKYSLGSYTPEKVFETQTLPLQKGDVIYMFTDGFADQFGGPFGKKFGYKQFKELLLDISKNNLFNLEGFLSDVLREWSGEQEQVDDILVMGFKI